MLPLNNAPEMPLLPYDILWEVISRTWLLPLQIQERVQLMSSSLLVSKTWMGILLRIMAKDSHIPCSSYLKRYMHLIRHAHPLFPTISFNDLCHSATVAVQFSSPGERNVLAEFLYELNLTGALPNLHRLSIWYDRLRLDDILDCHQFIDFPNQVDKLEVHYLESELEGNKTLVRRQSDSYPGWHLPSVKRLSIYNCNQRLLSSFLAACTKLKVVRTDLAPEILSQVLARTFHDHVPHVHSLSS